MARHKPNSVFSLTGITTDPQDATHVFAVWSCPDHPAIYRSAWVPSNPPPAAERILFCRECDRRIPPKSHA